MAAVRRGHEPMRVDLPNGTSSGDNNSNLDSGTTKVDIQSTTTAANASDLPPISALFLIYFDLKAGYTISWKRSLPGIELEGVVEYKSLPSGLHTVSEDLVYFVHDQYAGLSAFVNQPASAELRNARMIAVGVLVPLSYGRLGRSWKHAEDLKAMARLLVGDVENTRVLEQYWAAHKAGTDDRNLVDVDTPLFTPAGESRTPESSKKVHSRNRSASDGAALIPQGHVLTAHHPAWSLSRLLSIFGPLLFPIYRAALLRRRLLLSCHAPVQEVCDFVYDLSIISNIPLAVTPLIQPGAPPQRLRPLFTIGVHDIPFLEEDLEAASEPSASAIVADTEPADNELGNGWIACTTDGILGMKTQLYDLLITMPHTTSSDTSSWPTIIDSSTSQPVKATQRDLRRYKALRWSLSRSFSPTDTPSPSGVHSSSSTTPLVRRLSTSSTHTIGAAELLSSLPDTDTVVEPQSWAALAYEGFIWWASAGERQISLDEEFSQDASLLDDVHGNDSSCDAQPSGVKTGDGGARRELAIIAYFHRLTTSMFTTLSDIVDATESDDERESEDPFRDHVGVAGEVDDDEEAESGSAVFVSSADMAKMGLDAWSASDHSFIEEMCRLYFGRRATVEGKSVDVCGVRIC